MIANVGDEEKQEEEDTKMLVIAFKENQLVPVTSKGGQKGEMMMESKLMTGKVMQKCQL